MSSSSRWLLTDMAPHKSKGIWQKDTYSDTTLFCCSTAGERTGTPRGAHGQTGSHGWQACKGRLLVKVAGSSLAL